MRNSIEAIRGMRAPIDVETPTVEGREALRHFHLLRGRLADLGYSLHQLADGAVLVTRWGRSRQFADLDDTEAFLATLQGRS